MIRYWLARQLRRLANRTSRTISNMPLKRTNQGRDALQEAAVDGLRVISNAADSASKVIVQSAADAVRVLTAAAADAAKVVATAAAVSAKSVDEKSSIDHDTLIRIEASVIATEKTIKELKAESVIRDGRMLKLEESRASLHVLVSIGSGVMAVETGLLIWSLFKAT